LHKGLSDVFIVGTRAPEAHIDTACVKFGPVLDHTSLTHNKTQETFYSLRKKL